MGLIAGKFAKNLKAFMLQVNKMEQKDAEKAIDAYSKKHEDEVYNAIRSITLTIPAGAIKTTGSATSQTNSFKIVLKDVIS